MNDQKKQLLRWIDDDQDKLIDFFSRFIQAKSPNPPGDTREAVKHICQFLDEERLPYKIIAPQELYPNIVGTFECGAPGRHLVLNGHIDVFPVGDAKDWKYDPWGGIVAEGRIYGRGTNDMKCGTTASIFTFAYLHRIRDTLKGRLTLTAVSDEETFGPWGARYLMEHNPEVHGDCCLNGEPTGHETRFGEKGILWMAFTVRTPGAHGAYPHVSPSATKIAARLMLELDEAFTEMKVPVPEMVAEVLKGEEKTIDKALGKGASEILHKVTINFGTIQGGLKVNMIPGDVVVEADIRLPVGLEKAPVLAEVEKVMTRYPEVSYEELNYSPPSYCDPKGTMLQYMHANIEQVTGHKATPLLSLGGTDCRLWRYRDIPAYIYGPYAYSMGSADEYVEVEEFINVVKVHVLSAYDYLSNSGT